MTKPHQGMLQKRGSVLGIQSKSSRQLESLYCEGYQVDESGRWPNGVIPITTWTDSNNNGTASAAAAAAWGHFTHHPDKATDDDDDDDDDYDYDYEDTVEEAYDTPLVLFEQQAEFNDNDGANDVQEDFFPPGKLFYWQFIQPLLSGERIACDIVRKTIPSKNTPTHP